MGIAYEIMKVLGFGPRTYLYKFDLGSSFVKKRVKETDAFIKFKDKGTRYIILKTQPAKVDKYGNKYFFMFETDVHSFDPETGKVLDESLESEFKERLKLNELQKFKELLKDVEEDAIKERAKDIYESITVTESSKDKKEGAEEEEITIDITVPNIKLSTTAEIKIDSLTPHDTINEVLSHILDGTVLNSLITPKRMDKLTLFGILTVGICLGWILMIIFAAFWPDLWRQFWGFAGSSGGNPPPSLITWLMSVIGWF
jgi:hypothetical protein